MIMMKSFKTRQLTPILCSLYFENVNANFDYDTMGGKNYLEISNVLALNCSGYYLKVFY